MEDSACLTVKNIGKPYARFDEGGQVNLVMPRLLRHRQTKGTEIDRPRLKLGNPALYSTQNLLKSITIWCFSTYAE